MDIIAHYASELWSFVAGLIGGAAGGSLLTFRFTRKTSVADQGTNVNQQRASAGGDVIGRDKISGRDQR